MQLWNMWQATYKHVCFFVKQNAPARWHGDRTACFYQVLIGIWSIVPFVSLFIHILNILIEIVENWWNMSFPMYVWSFREIPQAKLMSEVLFTIPDTSKGPLYIGKKPSVWIVYQFGLILVDILIQNCSVGHPKLAKYGKIGSPRTQSLTGVSVSFGIWTNASPGYSMPEPSSLGIN